MAIVNAGDIFEDHLPRIKRTKVIVEYGEPILTDQLDRNARKDLPNAVLREIQAMYWKNKELL